MKTTTTAHYEEAHADVLRQIEQIRAAVDAHATTAAATPSNWGHAGDMQHVRARLADVLAFLQAAA